MNFGNTLGVGTSPRFNKSAICRVATSGNMHLDSVVQCFRLQTFERCCIQHFDYKELKISILYSGRMIGRTVASSATISGCALLQGWMLFGQDYGIKLLTFNFCISFGIFLYDNSKISVILVYWRLLISNAAEYSAEWGESIPILYEYRFRIPKCVSLFTCIALRLELTGNIAHIFSCVKT